MIDADPMTANGAQTVRDAKRRLREQAGARRRDLHRAAARTAGGQLVENFFAALAPPPGTAISGYWPIRDEIDPRPLLAALGERGCVCALPAIVAMDQPLEFRRWQPGDALIRGRFGTSEPAADAEIVTPAMLLVPLLAFDRRGNRLGYGAGFYDRSIAALRRAGPAVAIGLAYAGQEVDNVPHDPADVPLDWLITETGAICVGDQPAAGGRSNP